MIRIKRISSCVRDIIYWAILCPIWAPILIFALLKEKINPTVGEPDGEDIPIAWEPWMKIGLSVISLLGMALLSTYLMVKTVAFLYSILHDFLVQFI